ncbi:MAG: 3'-5' exoribonuclease YhaM family protein [Thermoguttaceae bacterium]
MTRQSINQLRDNDKVEEVFQVFEKQLRPNKNGNLYLQFTLSDKTGMMSGRFWNATDQQFYQFENGDYILADGATQRFQGVLQFIAKKLTKVDAEKVNAEDFVRIHQVDMVKRRAKLQELLRSVSNGDLLNLADCFLIDETFMERFCKVPAGVKLHHACQGGLLEHSVQMMELAEKVAAIYPELNRDIILFGTFLHDIGKTVELTNEGEMAYTDSGQILGHPILGIEILNEKIVEAEKMTHETFPAELAMLLKHLIISHHGSYKNQSPKLPMTLEAVALHYIDCIDSQLAAFRKHMIDDPNVGSPWTNYISGIERKLYKKGIE